MRLKAACAQFSPEKADLDANLRRIGEICREASELGVDLLVFPETITTAYFLEGGVLEASLTPTELSHSLEVHAKVSRPIDIVLGFYERGDEAVYNSAAYVELGPDGPRIRAVYRKFFLPTYGVFDEERFVAAGREVCVVHSRLGKVGILICEDVWHSILSTLCAIRGAQILAVPAASPARGFEGPDIRNHDRYHRMMRSIAEEHGLYCLNAQLSGFEGGKGFVGGSMIIDPTGATLAQAPLAEDALVTADLDLDAVTLARNQTPLLSDLKTVWADIRRLTGESG